MTHPTTQRINRARAERGIPKSTMQQLIGMSQETWRRLAARRGRAHRHRAALARRGPDRRRGVMDDEITERIYRAISDKRMFKQEVRQLAGHTESRWRRAERKDDWRYSEAVAIARVLRMPVKTLIGAP